MSKISCTPPSHYLKHSFSVEKECHGMRLDHFLRKKLKRLSRSRIQRVIRGYCIVNEKKSKPSQTVLTGYTVTFWRPPPIEPQVDKNIKLVYVDPFFYAFEKPTGLPMHPSARYHHSTFTAALKEKFPNEPLQIAHRLDRETSGLVLVARNTEAGSMLKQAFAKRIISKRYLAIVHGIVEKNEFEISLPIGPCPKSKVLLKMATISKEQGGLAAHTKFRVLQRYSNFSLVECKPITGRQHQIRVHLASCGHPIVGDKLYKNEELFLLFIEKGQEAVQDLLPMTRQALHASGLSFKHPISHQWIEILSPLPTDLKNFLESLEVLS